MNQGNCSKMMKYMDCVIFGIILTSGIVLGTEAQACSTTGWTFTSASNVAAGSPATVKRISQKCGLAVTQLTSVWIPLLARMRS